MIHAAQLLSEPFLFLPPPTGTSGDNKPLAILAVYAAEVAVLPVTLVSWREQEQSFIFLHKLFFFILGENWATKLKIIYLDDRFTSLLQKST